jgi:hypothetical protein
MARVHSSFLPSLETTKKPDSPPKSTLTLTKKPPVVIKRMIRENFKTLESQCTEKKILEC